MKAVNSHEALVEAAKRALEILEYSEPRNPKTEALLREALKQEEDLWNKNKYGY